MRIEPEGDVVLRAEIPPPCPPNVDKGYWDAVVSRLALLTEDEALQISFPGDQITSSMKSSLFTAAARAGRRVTILVRGAYLYAWLSGERERKRYLPPRPPFVCEVCGRVIVPPKSGASRQYVCGLVAGRASRCQRVRRYAKENGVTVREADEHFRAWHAKRKGARVAA
jgi:hypothetical protein